MIRQKLIWFLIAALALASSCAKKAENISETFAQREKQIQTVFVPDKSLDVFDAELIHLNNQWILKGETTVPAAREALLAVADSLLGANGYQNKLMLLPDSSLGDSAYALVSVSVAHLRDAPRHSAKMVDQTIMGRPLRLLKKLDGWYLTQTEYKYVGWVNSSSLHRTDLDGVQAWQKAPKVRVIDLYPMVRSMPDASAEPVTDVVLNVELRKEGKTGRWIKVSTPDGRTGYIEAKNVTINSPGENSPNRERASIIRTARSMMGIPYLWGGNSSKGSDCSGFTQTVFNANGMQLPRDARQQALEGEEIVPDDDFSNVQPGDLLFFGNGKRVTHVGISLGGAEFIHQSGDVHVNSLDPQAPNYSKYRREHLMKITRVITN